jgi:hypothetical protein
VKEIAPHTHSQLFTVRLWAEDLGEEQIEWRGQVQHVITGRFQHFREWQSLIEFFLEVLSNLNADQD